MPPSTVTVCAAGSKATILAIGRTDTNSSVLFAMVLKQWRVPSTFSLLCLTTNSRTCSTEFAGYRRCVPYSRLPDQFVNFSSGIAASSGEMIGLATIAEESLINVRLFMASPSSAQETARGRSRCHPGGHPIRIPEGLNVKSRHDLLERSNSVQMPKHHREATNKLFSPNSNRWCTNF